MRRGTTPTITITTDIDLTPASNLFVTFKQGAYKRIEKTLEDVTVTEDSVSFNLSQKETLLLEAGTPVDVQIRASLGDSKLASNIMTTDVEAILKQGEI